MMRAFRGIALTQTAPASAILCLSRMLPTAYSVVQFALNGGRPVAVSIPATEHSVMTAWASERQAIENMVDRFGGGFFACVMDSYDYAAVRAWRGRSGIPATCAPPAGTTGQS